MSQWKNITEFLKALTRSPLAGSAVIHVDTATPHMTSQTQVGMLYEDSLKADAIAMEPALTCPVCARVLVTDVDRMEERYYTRETSRVNSREYRKSLPTCPVKGFEHTILVCFLAPCGCQVSTDWAGSFKKELNSRIAGNPAKAVIEMTSQQRATKLRKLEKTLEALYRSKRSGLLTDGQLEVIEYWMVVAVDQMRRLDPCSLGRPTNMMTDAWFGLRIGISEKVRNWAVDVMDIRELIRSRAVDSEPQHDDSASDDAESDASLIGVDLALTTGLSITARRGQFEVHGRGGIVRVFRNRPAAEAFIRMQTRQQPQDTVDAALLAAREAVASMQRQASAPQQATGPVIDAPVVVDKGSRKRRTIRRVD